MKNYIKALIGGCLAIMLVACGQEAEKVAEAEVAAEVEKAAAIEVVQPAVNLLEITASGIRFQGEQSISSGWTTIRLNNLDDMLHFAMIVKLPEGVTASAYSNDLGSKFQQGYELMLEGKDEEVAEVFGSVPSWVGELRYFGGPGFVSGNRMAEATMYLEPGHYMLECYIKSNGIFHSYSPDPDQLAMLLELTVTDQPGNMAEPDANVTLTVNDNGYQLTEGQLKAGENTIRVQFETQIRYPSFVGQDVHIIQIEGEDDVVSALGWMDWRTPDGLQVPSPVTFIGGINDMPEGSSGYFKAMLNPGKYAFVGEVPEADQKGLLLAFEIQ